MNLGLIVFILALAAGLISGYTTRVWLRAVNVEELIGEKGTFRRFVGALTFPAMLVAIVWGFIYLTWWWVILAFLGVSLFVVPLVVTPDRLGPMLLIQPVFDIACIALTAYLWIAGPFR